MTPFEQQQPPSPKIKRLKLEERQYSGNPPVSPTSQCFDVSAAWYHPGPFNVQAIQPITPHPVLLRHEVPELSYNSTDLSASEKDRSRGDPISEQSGLNTQTNNCCACGGIGREREGPSARTPGSADIFNLRSQALPNHRHRRHSLFYEPISLSADKGLRPLGQQFDPLRRESTLIEVESKPLEEECNTLEADSKLLEYEAMPLKEAHSYEDPYYPGAEERLSRHRVSLDDWDDFCRVQKARSELRLENEKTLSTSKSQI